MKKKQPSVNEQVMGTMFRILGSVVLILIVAIGIDIAKLFS